MDFLGVRSVATVKVGVQHLIGRASVFMMPCLLSSETKKKMKEEQRLIWS
jgi:hypothetical protein